MISKVQEYLGDKANFFLEYKCKGIDKESLHLPGPDFVERVLLSTDRPTSVLRNMQMIFNTGRLSKTGYLSILPVDQGIEHSAGASFAPNPIYFDPENIVKLAIEGGCNAVASTLGVLGAVSRRYAHKIPFIVKINHNEFISYPNSFDQILFAEVRRFNSLMNWEWSPCSGAICGTRLLKPKKKIIMSRLISLDRQTILASRLKPILSNRSCPKIMVVTMRLTSERRINWFIKNSPQIIRLI